MINLLKERDAVVHSSAGDETVGKQGDETAGKRDGRMAEKRDRGLAAST